MGTSIASDPAQQDGIDSEQPEHGGADGDKDEIHGGLAPNSGAADLSPIAIKVRRLRPSAGINET